MSRYLKVLIVIVLGLLMFSVARATLYIMDFDTFSTYTVGDIISSFIDGLRFDLSITLTLLSPFIVLLLLPIKNMIFHKILLWCIFVELVVLGFVSGTDIGFYLERGRHITNDFFLLSNDLGFMIDLIPSYIIPGILFLIVCIVLGYFYNKFVNIKLKPDLKFMPLNLLIFIILIPLLYIPIRGNIDEKPIHIIDAFDVDTTLGNLKLNGVFSIFKYSDEGVIDLSTYNFFDNATAQQIVDNFTINSDQCNTDIVENLSQKGVNIVFIMLEGIPADLVDSFSNRNLGITKNIDNLSLKSIKFNNHYSPNKRSIASLQAVMTGIPPIAALPSIGFGLESYFTGDIGQVFVDNGYNTLFIQSAKRRSYYMDSIARSLGFEQYYGKEDIPIILDYKDKNGAFFGWDYETLMFLSGKLDELNTKNKNPFLAFTFLGTTHEPLPELPSEFNVFDPKTDPDAKFKNTIIYTDWAIGEFMNSIKDKPYFDNTVFIISSDHSVSRGVTTAYPYDHLIPLMMYSKKMDKAIEIDHITSHLDMSQTLYDIANFDNVSKTGSLFCKDESSFTMLFNGDLITMIAGDGHAYLSFDKVMSSNLKDNSTARLEGFQNYLKAYYQLLIDKFNK